MKEFRTRTLNNKHNKSKDHRFVQLTLLLAAAFLVLFIFEPSSARNIVLFVIISWGLLLHFSHYVFQKEDGQDDWDNILIIRNTEIIINNRKLIYGDIELIDIYIHGYQQPYQHDHQEKESNDGMNNTITIKTYEGQTYFERFWLTSNVQTYELTQALESLDSSTKEKINLLKNTSQLNF